MNDMTNGTALDGPSRLDLARRYARGEITIHELRRAGHLRMIELLSDLHELGEHQPLAEMTGPNVALRQAGLARLGAALQR